MKQIDITSLVTTIVAAIVACVAMYLVSKNSLPLSAALAIVSATHAATGSMKSFLLPTASAPQGGDKPDAAPKADSAPASAPPVGGDEPKKDA